MRKVRGAQEVGVGGIRLGRGLEREGWKRIWFDFRVRDGNVYMILDGDVGRGSGKVIRSSPG
jgi:hypothetical protein